MFKSRLALLCLLAVLLVPAGPVHAASCGNSGAGFSKWLQGFKRQAVSKGISKRVIASALNGVTYNKRVVRLDRSQRSFKLSFKQFYARRVSNALIKQGRRKMKQYGSTPEAHRETLWRSSTGDHCNLGFGDRLRPQFGQDVGYAFAGNSGL